MKCCLNVLVGSVFLAAVFFVYPGAPRAGEQQVRWVVPRNREAVVLGLVAPYRTLAPVEPGTWFERIALTDASVDFVVTGREPPAGPVVVAVRWDGITASKAQRPEIRVSVEGLADDTPDNLRRSVELLHHRIRAGLTDACDDLLRPVQMESSGESGGSFIWPEAFMSAYPALLDRPPESMGITQVGLEAVAETAPEPPQGVWVFAALIPAVLLAGLGFRRFLRGGRPWEVAWGVLASAGVVAVWWLLSEMSEEGYRRTIRSREELEYLIPMHRDFLLAWVFLGVGLAASAGAAAAHLVGALRDRGEPTVPLGETGIAICLAAAGLLVRFGLGSPELLTDGGSGFERMLQYNFGYGGMSILLTWLLPAAMEGQVWPAISVNAALAGLAPAALYRLARELEFDRGPAALAGMALVCWPLHAALFTSDFLQGPVLTFGLAGLAWTARATRTGRAAWLLPGAVVFSALIWMRPDAVIWALPFAAAAAPTLWRGRGEGAPWLAVGYGALALGCRLLSYAQSPGILPEGDGNHLSLNIEGFLLAGHEALPWWIWLGIPAGIPVLWTRHRTAGLVAAGGLAAWLSLKVGGSPPDLLEFFRYLAPAMAWVSLVAGMGLARLACFAPAGRLRVAVAATLAAGLAATPLIHAGYLGTSYGPRDSDRVLREVLHDLPGDCSLVVPGEVRRDGLDPAPRYRYTAWEEKDREETSIPGNRVLSAAIFSEFLGAEGRLPRLDDLDLAWRGAVTGETCWYFLRTGECTISQGFNTEAARDPGTCRAVHEALDLEPVETWAVPYRNHRLVTQARERRPPKYDDDFTYVLYRVRGLRRRP